MKHKAARLGVSAQTLCGSMIAASRLLCPWNSLGKNAGVGCHFLLQGLFPTQGSNPCLLHWQVNSLPLSHRGSPCVLSHTCIYAHSCVLFVYSLCVSLSYRQCLRYTDGFESLTTDFPSRLFGYNFHNFNMLQFSSVQLLSCVRLFATP